ncbi:MAG: RdgB/HAM1 family non-canonical purine NTP pyrophosphatase [Rhodospirillaceae bacterium]|jgi:XTP/dITP diphosphohydrolase|nr:RdgB/HAM1 family non-canonical purine NTP pyrophosphatase [Rhodospirillaceae bacterium]MBT5943945.1 RdgB/HAM1 family non-canonical purine NTP pyrophosphatase [Rhodospirillaceae bacterium]MBT6405530.1 RdgB/HAM1 family non-canonical purine NTP pyrophosphatase [Rhodospirillaceae bacterium]MBT6537009.1 RdgB/HAM1 family non-canonical purine NTP pyrophosphatase [Rhodospirillaceae bacterium]MBT7362960.1 RdgB/HAM1 family non-canonical purine NTP pyrophosphatase [Rhodospirillaceae bacterium]
MARHFEDSRLVIASHNAGKVREIADLLKPFAVSVQSAGALGLPEPEETGATFAENAILKARASAAAPPDGSGQAALADDSGFSVAALGGAPGIHAARFAERADGVRDFDWAMEQLHEASAEAGEDLAWFTCALALAWPDGHVEVFEGRVDGSLAWPPRGDRGFGYDPIFVPRGGTLTFAEMDPDAKHAISHRAIAFRALIDACFKPG